MEKLNIQKGISGQNHKDNMIDMSRIAKDNNTTIKIEKGCSVATDKNGKKYYDYGKNFF